VKSQLCNTVLLGGYLCIIVPVYSSAITHIFVINDVILVALSHIFGTVYLKSNGSSCGTSGFKGRILHKIHNFYWSLTSTKEANMVAIGK